MMYIKSVQKVSYFHVTVADSTKLSGESEFRRLAHNCWEELLGSSWEPCYSKEAELDALWAKIESNLATYTTE